MATPVAKTYDWKQALRTHEQAPDRVTLYRILERLMQASIVQRYTDSARTQRFALTQRAAVGLFECDNCHHVIPIEQDPALEAAIGLVKSHLTGHGMTELWICLTFLQTCGENKGIYDIPVVIYRKEFR